MTVKSGERVKNMKNLRTPHKNGPLLCRSISMPGVYSSSVSCNSFFTLLGRPLGLPVLVPGSFFGRPLFLPVLGFFSP